MAKLTSTSAAAAASSAKEERIRRYQIIDDGSSTPAGIGRQQHERQGDGGGGRYGWMSKEASMGDAYRELVKGISQSNVQLRLKVANERDLVRSKKL